MVKYCCEKCGKIFSQKGHYTIILIEKDLVNLLKII